MKAKKTAKPATTPKLLTWSADTEGSWKAQGIDARIIPRGKRFIGQVNGKPLAGDTGAVRYFSASDTAMDAVEEAVALLTLEALNQVEPDDTIEAPDGGWSPGPPVIDAPTPALSAGAETAVSSFLASRQVEAAPAAEPIAAPVKKEKAPPAPRKAAGPLKFPAIVFDKDPALSPLLELHGFKVEGDEIRGPKGFIDLTPTGGSWVPHFPSGETVKGAGGGARTFTWPHKAVEALVATA